MFQEATPILEQYRLAAELIVIVIVQRMLDDSVVRTGRMKRSKRCRFRDRSFTTQEQRLIMAAAVGRFNMPGRLDSPAGWFMINRRSMPPSSSGLGYLVLSQGTGVRVPVGVLEIDPSA